MSKRKSTFQSEAARLLYERTIETFELDQHHIETLKLACDTLDRIAAAQAALHRDGDIIKDRYNCPKAHPAQRMLESNKIIFSRLLRELRLDDGQTHNEMEL
ncbi:MAG: P27 family phage terminase small subunit [Phycisphaerae bacterium]|nr:P27 family phage terminase small subunit [Phycisphaerae bacterium]